MGRGLQKAYWPWYSLNEPEQGYQIKFCEERRAAHQVTCICEISVPEPFTSQNHATCIEKAVWSESAKLMNLWASSCGLHKVQWLPDYSDLGCCENARASAYCKYLLLYYRFDYLLGISCNTGRLEKGLSRRDWRDVVEFLWTRNASIDTYTQPPTKVKNAAPKVLLISSEAFMNGGGSTTRYLSKISHIYQVEAVIAIGGELITIQQSMIRRL